MRALAIVAVVLGGATGFALGWLDVGPPWSSDARGHPVAGDEGSAGGAEATLVRRGTGSEQRLLDALSAASDRHEIHWPWPSEPKDAADDADNPVAVFQAALEMSNVMARRLRLRDAVTALAETNPLLALDLIETIPNELMRRGMFRLAVDIWAQGSPAAAAEWLIGAPAGVARLALPAVAAHWGSRDFATASAFADRLSGTPRTTYLYRLARIERPTGELLAWAGKYRNDRAFAGIVERVVGQLGDDVDATLALLGELSGAARERGVQAAIYWIARTNPDTALELAAASTGNVWRNLYPDLIRGFAEKNPERAAAFLAERVAEVREEPQHLITTPGLVTSLLWTWAKTDPDAASRWSLGLDDPWLRNDALAGVAIYAHAQRPDIARRAFEMIANRDDRWRAVDMLMVMAASDDDALQIARDFGYGEIDLQDVVRRRSSVLRSRTIDVDCPSDAVRYGVR